MAQKANKNGQKSTENVETEEVETLSTSELVEAAGVTRQYIASLERAGVIHKVGYGRWPKSSVAEIAAFRAQREKAELDLAERRGELQSRAENEEKAAMMATDARKRMLAVPERVAGRFGLPREVIEGIAEEIRDALVELSTMGEP
jgi:hypothetical protein